MTKMLLSFLQSHLRYFIIKPSRIKSLFHITIKNGIRPYIKMFVWILNLSFITY